MSVAYAVAAQAHSGSPDAVVCFIAMARCCRAGAAPAPIQRAVMAGMPRPCDGDAMMGLEPPGAMAERGAEP